MEKEMWKQVDGVEKEEWMRRTAKRRSRGKSFNSFLLKIEVSDEKSQTQNLQPDRTIHE